MKRVNDCGKRRDGGHGRTEVLRYVTTIASAGLKSCATSAAMPSLGIWFPDEEDQRRPRWRPE